MKIIDVFILPSNPSGSQVLLQAATEEGHRWLKAVQEGIRFGEVLILETEAAIESIFSTIPDTLETMTF